MTDEIEREKTLPSSRVILRLGTGSIAPYLERVVDAWTSPFGRGVSDSAEEKETNAATTTAQGFLLASGCSSQLDPGWIVCGSAVVEHFAGFPHVQRKLPHVFLSSAVVQFWIE